MDLEVVVAIVVMAAQWWIWVWMKWYWLWKRKLTIEKSGAYGEDKYRTQCEVGDEYIVTVAEGEIAEMEEE